MLGKKQINNKTADMGGAALFRLLMYFPLLGYLAPLGCYFGVDKALLVYSAGGTGTAIGFWASLFIALLGTSFFLIHKLVNFSRDGELKFSKIKSEIISLAFLLVLLVSTFFSSINADVMVRRGYSVEEDTLKIGYSDVVELSLNDVLRYSGASWEEAENALLDELRSKGIDHLDKTLMNWVIVGCGRIDPSYIYIAIAIINILVLLFAASLSSRLMKKAVYSCRAKRVALLKVLLVLLTLAQCVLIFITCIIANESVGDPLDFAIHFGIGTAPVLALVAAVGALVSSNKADPDKRFVDNYYDNPDVSYAPYVIGLKKK